MTARAFARSVLPRPLRSVLRPALTYFERLGRWSIVLGQVRGTGWADEVKLAASAIAAPITALRHLREWQDPVLLFDADVTVAGIGRFRLRRRSDDLWHVLPWREQGIHDALRAILRPGDVFVDAGANIGVYSLLASRLVGPAGRVIAIEMMPDTAGQLRLHLDDNDCRNVEVVDSALSNESERTIFAHVPVGRYGKASIATAAPPVGHDRYEVVTTTLDEICAGVDRIDLLKLDLEGAELQALAGAKATLGKAACVIYESHTDGAAIAALLDGAGFTQSRSFGKDVLAERRDAPSSAPGD